MSLKKEKPEKHKDKKHENKHDKNDKNERLKKRVLKHIEKDDKEFRQQIAEDKELARSLKHKKKKR